MILLCLKRSGLNLGPDSRKPRGSISLEMGNSRPMPSPGRNADSPISARANSRSWAKDAGLRWHQTAATGRFTSLVSTPAYSSLTPLKPRRAPSTLPPYLDGPDGRCTTPDGRMMCASSPSRHPNGCQKRSFISAGLTPDSPKWKAGFASPTTTRQTSLEMPGLPLPGNTMSPASLERATQDSWRRQTRTNCLEPSLSGKMNAPATSSPHQMARSSVAGPPATMEPPVQTAGLVP